MPRIVPAVPASTVIRDIGSSLSIALLASAVTITWTLRAGDGSNVSGREIEPAHKAPHFQEGV